MTEQNIETGSALAIRDDQHGFTPTQLATLAQLGVQGAPQGDLEVFFHQAKATGLDPFKREIYMIKRAGKWTIQTGIDGFYKTADRATRATRGTWGIPETMWCGQDGIWRDVWLAREAPAAAKVTVVRDGSSFTAVALTSEYRAAGPMWDKMPARMVAKCAEALAIRKAFPADLSGLYTADEMRQADTHTVTQQRPAATQTGRQGAAGIIAQAQQVAQPAVDWFARVAAIDSAGEANDVWRAASKAGALDDNLKALITARVADLKAESQVDEATGEIVDAVVVAGQTSGYDDQSWLAGQEAQA